MINIQKLKLFFKAWWRILVIIITPLAFLPLPLLVNSIQGRCAYVVLVLTTYWVFEAIPYAVASLLPLAFFPMAGIIPGSTIGHNYFKDISTLFLGSMILAHAMEQVHLHRRLALLVLKVVGSSVKWSMAGIMLVTDFLSMWINNSAATSIMIPAALAVVDEFQKHHEHQHQVLTEQRQSHEVIAMNGATVLIMKRLGKDKDNEPSSITSDVDIGSSSLNMNDEDSSIPSTVQFVLPKTHIDYAQLKTGFLIAVAYSSAVGGMGTLVGTGPNIFVKGFAEQFYATGPYAFEVSFANFLLFALPISVILIVICWFWLQLLYNRKELCQWRNIDANVRESQKHVQLILRQQYDALGSFSWQEGTVTVLFVILVILWVTRDFSHVNGWGHLFRKEFVTDGTAALLIGSLTLIFPNKNPFRTDNWEYHPILGWEQVSRIFPWGVFMLQGAGLAIADGFKASDLSSTIANFLHFVVGASQTVVIFVVIVVSAIFTEFTSNLACASILFPILDSIAKTAHIHPGYLILSSCMGVSLSFMLPIATPPNAMILASNNVRVRDLIKAGFGFKLIGIAIIFIASISIISPIFNIQSVSPNFNTTLPTNKILTVIH